MGVNKMIGIIGAMKSEIEDLKHFITNAKSESISSIEFTTGTLWGVDCILAVSGVGKVNSAVCTQTMIMKFNPDLIINIGVAGGIDDKINICDIVIADYVMQHDMDTSELGDAKGFISGINLIKLPCDKELINKVKNAANEEELRCHIGTIMSGDQFIANREKLIDLKNQFNGLACDMESGSIGQVCYLNNTRFIAIRSISDNVNAESKMDYQKFLERAVKNTHRLLFRLINIL